MNDDPEADLAAATDELYGLDPVDFVPARNDLVRRLRKEGDRDLATWVAGLRRPTPAAWAVNQLARTQRGVLDGLLSLGDALRRAQTQALAGAEAGALRDAARSRRDAVAGLAESAVSLLAERGQGRVHYTEIAATLDAATLYPQAGLAVASGRLTSALEPPSGFGELGFDAVPTVPATPSPAGDPDPEAGNPDQGAAEGAEQLADAERAVAAAAGQASALAAEARDATALAARREEEVADAEAHVRRMQRELDEARGRAAASRRGADRAKRAAQSAEAAAAEAVERLREAEQRTTDLRPE